MAKYDAFITTEITTDFEQPQAETYNAYTIEFDLPYDFTATHMPKRSYTVTVHLREITRGKPSTFDFSEIDC